VVDTVDLHQLEEKYRDRWSAEFQADPSGKEKFYLNVAFPYPSGAMHVGHGRTYTVPDIVARFFRMRGRQVLFPMGFHVTGTPVIGISKRIARKDEKTIWLYRDLYGVPQEVMETFTDPMVIVRYFAGEYERIMRSLGLSIDWRRRFITVDPQYSKFIEWQYKHLHALGYVVKGVHPVKFCPQCDNPVGDHDLLEGERAEIIRFVLVMFRFGDAFIPTATLRPETVYGVTNLWVNPKVTYVKAMVDGKAWIISREAAEKLKLQDHTVTIGAEIPGKDLVGKKASHPLSGEIPILPADFVDPEMASGMVMSVPAHAPYDYIALRDLQEQGLYTEIRPKSLLTLEGHGEFPAISLQGMRWNGQASVTRGTRSSSPSPRRSTAPSSRGGRCMTGLVAGACGRRGTISRRECLQSLGQPSCTTSIPAPWSAAAEGGSWYGSSMTSGSSPTATLPGRRRSMTSSGRWPSSRLRPGPSSSVRWTG
jgi:leucyl-tRNA synthetase